MGVIKDMTGVKLGRLTFVRNAQVPHARHIIWECKCDCGQVVYKTSTYARYMKYPSCGCWQHERRRENSRKQLLKHGKYGTQVYRAWAGMKTRCYAAKEKQYHLYGGRGIKVYEPRRVSFVKFYEDMGDPPGQGYSLDRINNDGNYEPGNVRWADKYTQQNNKRNNRLLTVRGQTLTLAQWGREMGISDQTINSRLRRGLSPEKAIYG